ncbi:hypothetical protein BGZ54_001775 [Gamsiella multidivaricata]|nr:hypothetical protein BGZ54_001775 [Gamsiella multidivaricata]
MAYYPDHNEYEELHVDEDEDEEYQEDLFLQQHYGCPPLGGLDLVHDEDSEDDDMYTNHYRRNYQHSYHDDDQDEILEVEEEDEYNEVDMDQHNIQLLSGSLSVRSPFLDAIREEEDEEPVFAKPSSYPTLGTGKHLHRLSSSGIDGLGTWGSRSSLSMALAEKQLQQKQQQQQQQQHQGGEFADQQQANFNNTNQSDGSKPRGPRPPLLLGRPRSNSSLTSTRLTTGFDMPGAATTTDEHVDADKTALRETQMSPENPIQDLEVKRVLEGAAALASATSSSPIASGPDSSNSADSTPLPSSVHANGNVISLSKSAAGRGTSTPSGEGEPTVAFGQDTQKSIDDFFGMVKSDLDKRIQEAIQEVEQKFLHRVQKLEEHTAALTGAAPDSSSDAILGTRRSGSLMDALTRPLPPDQNPGGSIALRKEILSHVTEKVGDLDLRVNQMEVLVSYKLVDIESKVQDLHGAHNSIAQKVHQVAKSHKSNMQGVRAGDGVGQNTITAEEERVAKAMKPYRDIDAQGRGAEAYLEPIIDDDGDNNAKAVVSIRGTSGRGGEKSTELVDASSAIVDLRHELQALGMRYQELNDGLLTDLMGQMRDAKLMLFQTVDEVDGRISKRVDRIEAEMHSKMLSEIEGRVQERVRAMEQTSTRLEKCFDKMEGRLGALETVLASRRPRPESMYQLLQQQLQQQQQQQDEDNGAATYHAGTFAGFSSSPSSGHRSVTSVLFSGADGTQYTPPRRRTLAENGIYPDNSQSTIVNGKDERRDSSSNMALTSSPLEGFVSPTHTKPVWSPVSGVSTNTATSPSPNSPYSTSLPTVASPLERGTVIGGRMGTIHPEYIPKTTYVPRTTSPTKDKSQHSAPSTPTKDRFQNSLPTTPIKERFQSIMAAVSQGQGSASAPAADQGVLDQTSRLRRVSLSSFDGNSLSALKPVRPSTPTTTTATSTSTSTSTSTATAAPGLQPSTTSVVTTTTTTAINATHRSGGNGSKASSSNANLKSVSSTSSLLSSKLDGTYVSSNNKNNSNSVKSNSSDSSTTKIVQRAMTFDMLNSQGTTATMTVIKTVKSPVQGPSSYRDLLHFWKAGGSGVGNTSSQSAAV